MDFTKELKIGRRVALNSQKKKEKLITFWVDEDLRNAASKKCPNVSAFLRLCLEKLVDSNIDKQVAKIYKDIATEAVGELQSQSFSKNGHKPDGETFPIVLDDT